MDAYQLSIHKLRYARFLPGESRREDWPETPWRYVHFFADRFPSVLTPDVQDELANAIIDLEVMPSMRALATAGPALARDEAAGFNCFSGETRFMTPEGVKTLRDAAGTTQTVLCKDGAWRPAQVKSFGTQILNRVTFQPGLRSNTKLKREVLVTTNHRWFVDIHGREFLTTDLQVGDCVRGNVPSDVDENICDFIRGFGFGDGTVDARGRARVRLCGKKARYLHIFEEYGHCSVMHPPSQKGDPLVVFHQGHFENWKEVPTTPSSGWVRGYLAADGSRGKSLTVSSQCSKGLDHLELAAPYAGFHITGRTTNPVLETNYGKRRDPLEIVTLRHASTLFKVTAIKKSVRTEEVFCVVEPETQSFTLEHGIVTGNCAAAALDDPFAFSEILYLLMCGAGAGFSVQEHHVAKLPVVKPFTTRGMPVIVVEDTRIGWAESTQKLIDYLYAGIVPTWDTSKVRKKGTPLKTFGGRASGPEPLENMFREVIEIFRGAQSRQLTRMECHRICCFIADCVVVGGVRRSALISLSDLDDAEIRDCKTDLWYKDGEGEWKCRAPELQLSNNSVCYHEKPDWSDFEREWSALVNSGAGERGIFNLAGARDHAAKFGGRLAHLLEVANPCLEILLRSCGLCNLSEIVARAGDTLEDLKRKARLAAILGTLQASLTNFRYLRPIWKKNAEEEALLGVSITGIMDNPILSGQTDHDLAAVLEELREVVRVTNVEWSAKLGIKPAVSWCCVKPSGTVSQLVDSASGAHARWSPFYIRRIRNDAKDPATKLLMDAGVPYELCNRDPENTVIFSFPKRAPEGAVCRHDMTAVEQLEHWRILRKHWATHTVSITIYVAPNEWTQVREWVWENFDDVTGISFLPKDDTVYPQAPYEDIDETDYLYAWASLPEIDWSLLVEDHDATAGAQERACAGGSCELV